MANDVILSTIFLGNFADIDPVETGDSRTENENDLLGTYGSAGSPLSGQIVNIESDSSNAVLEEDSYSTADDWIYDRGFGTVNTDLDSTLNYSADIVYSDGTTASGVGVFVVQMTNGDVFLTIGGQPELSAKAIESMTLQSVLEDDYWALYQPAFATQQFVCFGPCTMIRTPQGEVPVEALRPGDLVETLDHGARPLIWTGVRRLNFPGAPDSQKPFLFKAGCFGPGLPNRDLIASPQHRILCNTPQGDGFAIAKSFEPKNGVRQMEGRRAVTYHALLFDRHEKIGRAHV